MHGYIKCLVWSICYHVNQSSFKILGKIEIIKLENVYSINKNYKYNENTMGLSQSCFDKIQNKMMNA